MKTLLKTLVLLATLSSLPAMAQQVQEFGDYMVYYNALNTSMITPEIARSYGIRRSDSRGLINISILKKNTQGQPTAQKAVVTTSGRNLTGQTRTIDMREINENDGAVYYIGELSVRNMETFDFTVKVKVEGKNEPFVVKFRQQFFTE